MKRLILAFSCLLIMFSACEKQENQPLPTPQSAQDQYIPYIGTWSGIVIEKCGKDLIPKDITMDLFLKRATPADLRTYGTIAKGRNYYEATSQTEGVLTWQILFHVNPHQLIITRHLDGSLWRYYNIILFENDILKLENDDRYEFWCKY